MLVGLKSMPVNKKQVNQKSGGKVLQQDVDQTRSGNGEAAANLYEHRVRKAIV